MHAWVLLISWALGNKGWVLLISQEIKKTGNK